MTYYIELTLIDNQDFTTYQLWSKLYQQLHLALVAQKDAQDLTAYGVSFPHYRFSPEKNSGYLGTKLRIFSSSQQQLESLTLDKHLARLNEYIHITTVKAVPQDKVTGFACYFRARPKDNIQQRILHQAKRRNISIEQASAHFKDYVQTSFDLPFISLTSASSSTKFKLLIGKSLTEKAHVGNFGTYGLSREHTVPEF